MLRTPSLLARGIEPLVNALWTFFLVWTAIVVGLWLGGETHLPQIANSGLRSAAIALASASDPIWLFLASANLYSLRLEREGLTRTRILALVIFAVAAMIAACSAWTSYPLGTVLYPAHLGRKIGPVPVGWVLLWFVVVVSGRALAGKLLPRARHETVAVCTGVLALLTDLNLEPIATKVRLYWFCYIAGTHVPSPPLWRNYLTWVVAATALSWFAREQKVAPATRESWRSALVIIIFNAVLILAHLREALFR